MVLLYTKFQLNRTKTVGGVIRKEKFTDGQTNAEGYNIVRPFFKRAYKNGKTNRNFMSLSIESKRLSKLGCVSLSSMVNYMCAPLNNSNSLEYME